jgi:hypothetical protein
MHALRRSRALAVVATLGCAEAALGACFGGSSGSSGGAAPRFDASPDVTFFDSPSGDAPTVDSPPAEGSAVDVEPGEAAGDGGATLCTAIDLSAAPFVDTVTNVTGQAPAMTGGAIVPGDYAQTTVTDYDPSGTMVTGESPARSIFRFGTTSYHADTQVWFAYDASPDSPPSDEAVVVFDYVTDGSTITLTAVCDSVTPDAGGGAVHSNEYTATPTTYQFTRTVSGDAGIVEIVTYTKQ